MDLLLDKANGSENPENQSVWFSQEEKNEELSSRWQEIGQKNVGTESVHPYGFAS